jgi:transposase-like protein
MSRDMARWPHAPLFRGRHFANDVITWAVRWDSRYSLSLRELADLLRERNMVVDHTTLWHWVQRYTPELDKRLRSQLRPVGIAVLGGTRRPRRSGSRGRVCYS